MTKPQSASDIPEQFEHGLEDPMSLLADPPNSDIDKELREILNQFAFNLSLTENHIGGLDREQALESVHKCFKDAGYHEKRPHECFRQYSNGQPVHTAEEFKKRFKENLKKQKPYEELPLSGLTLYSHLAVLAALEGI